MAAYRVLALVPPDDDEGIMALLNVNAQEVLGGKVSAALEATVAVELCVVRLKVVIGSKGHGVSMGRQGAPHDVAVVVVVVVFQWTRVQLGDLGNGPQVDTGGTVAVAIVVVLQGIRT